MKKSELKIALAHDYLREYGGAERVLEALHELFPEAPVYVAFCDPRALGRHWQRFADWKIKESWITKIPGYKKLFSPLRIWAPNFFQSFDLKDFDVVISSSNAYFAKAIRVPKPGTHISYCHTPARSLYGYVTMTDWKKNPLMKWAGTLINHYLRIKDFEVARSNVDVFIANSQETKRRIKKFYRLDSTVIYPPVIVPDRPPALKKNGEYFLYVGRIAQSKHVDLAILACTHLGLPLKVVGEGKGVEYLQGLAGPTVEFVGGVSDAQLHDLYASAKALIFPAEDEDFGIVPIEAMGHGVPVIAHASGGPLETVLPGKTGMLFNELTVESLVAAIIEFNKKKFDAKKIYEFARGFGVERFKKEIMKVVEKS
jgi:glycosyltransferase involved in cell wall biosynthesis